MIKFPYGSHVYGTNDEQSDKDYIFVGFGDNTDPPNFQEGDVQCYSTEEFEEMILQHDITALECLWQDVDHAFKFDLDNDKLRESISAKVSHSWVKAKKKINQGDIRIGQKSLFHSLRVLMYGCQIAKYGKIVNYSCANRYWDNIKQITDWKELDNKFRIRKNKLKTKFKLLCPAEKNIVYE